MCSTASQPRLWEGTRLYILKGERFGLETRKRDLRNSLLLHSLTFSNSVMAPRILWTRTKRTLEQDHRQDSNHEDGIQGMCHDENFAGSPTKPDSAFHSRQTDRQIQSRRQKQLSQQLANNHLKTQVVLKIPMLRDMNIVTNKLGAAKKILLRLRMKVYLLMQVLMFAIQARQETLTTDLMLKTYVKSYVYSVDLWILMFTYRNV